MPISRKPRKKFNNRKLLMTNRARIWNAYRTFEPIYDLLTSLYDGEAVSYTHLDVYKRQARARTRARRTRASDSKP